MSVLMLLPASGSSPNKPAHTRVGIKFGVGCGYLLTLHDVRRLEH